MKIKWLLLVAVFGILFAAGAAMATTIGTNISTGGTLTVTLGATLQSTVGVTGATSLSSTLSVADTATLASTTIDITGAEALLVRKNADAGDVFTVNTTSSIITASGTLKVVNFTTSDLVNVFDGATEVFTILDGGNVGVGSSTPQAVFSVGSGASTTIDISKGCFQGNSTDGTRYHFWFKNDGNIGTSTGNCP